MLFNIKFFIKTRYLAIMENWGISIHQIKKKDGKRKNKDGKLKAERSNRTGQVSSSNNSAIFKTNP